MAKGKVRGWRIHLNHENYCAVYNVRIVRSIYIYMRYTDIFKNKKIIL